MPVPNIKTDTTTTVVKAATRAGVPVLLISDPGVGKSSFVEALAASENAPLECVVASLREPADFAGLPVITGNGVELAAPAWAKRLAAFDGPSYLFLDEVSTANPPVQAACLRVVLDLVVGDLSLPRSVRVIAAANPPESAAGGWDLAPALANRFMHIAFTPTADAWIDGMVAGFATPPGGRVYEPGDRRLARARATVAAFVRARPDLLHRMPKVAEQGSGAWPSRRSWDMTARVLSILDPDDTAAILLAATGLVGEGAAHEFVTWLGCRDLPDPNDVLEDPSAVAWTDLDPSSAWAVLAGVVATAASRKTVDSWRKAWEALAAAHDAGMGDVAVASVRTLMRTRPGSTRPPAAARALAGMAAEAGLL